MITAEEGFWSKVKEFLGYLLLASWATLLLAEMLPLGINVKGNSLVLGFAMSVFLCLGYMVAGTVLGSVFRRLLRVATFGRIGEFLVGVAVGAGTLALFNEVTPESLTIAGPTAAITGGIIGSAFVVMLGTAFGRLTWSGGAAWPTLVRKAPAPVPAPARRKVRGAGSEPELFEPVAPPPEDTRTFEASFDKPTRVRLEHDGKVVFDRTLSGNVCLKIGSYAPPYGRTILFVNDERLRGWQG
jgi:hypothetical protein